MGARTALLTVVAVVGLGMVVLFPPDSTVGIVGALAAFAGCFGVMLDVYETN